MNLYLHDVNGKLIRRLTDVDADVEFVAVDPAGKYVLLSFIGNLSGGETTFPGRGKKREEKPFDDGRGMAQYHDEW